MSWGERIGFRAKLLRELIPLLFRCYSAVSSAVIPLLIPLLVPLLIPRRCDGIDRKYLNLKMFSRRIFAKPAQSNFFPCYQGNLILRHTRNLSTASRRGASCQEREMFEERALSLPSGERDRRDQPP